MSVTFMIKNIIRNFVGESAEPKVDDFIWLLQQMDKWENIEMTAAKTDCAILYLSARSDRC